MTIAGADADCQSSIRLKLVAVLTDTHYDLLKTFARTPEGHIIELMISGISIQSYLITF